jgi:hypothetical protein
MLSPRKYKFLDSFRPGADGKYVYTGDTFALKGNYKSAYLKMSLMCIALALCTVGSGFINAAGMNNTFYVIIPYAGEIICLFVILWNSTRIIYAGQNVRAYIYEPCVPRIYSGALALSVFSLVAFVGSVVFTVLHGFEGKTLHCIFYWFLKLITVPFGIALNRFVKKLEWEKL